jgi:tetratricopeptide (TPR) repeat protein
MLKNLFTVIFIILCSFGCASQNNKNQNFFEESHRAENEVHFNDGVNFINQSDFDAAFEKFYLAERVDLNKAIILNSYAHFQNGLNLSQNKNYDSAIENFTWVIENMTRVNTGKNIMEMQQYRNSLYIWSQLYGYSLFGLSYNSYIFRGNCYKDIGQLQNAISDYSKAIEISEDAEIYISRGDIYFEMEKYILALNDYSSAINIIPNSPDINIRIEETNRRIEEIERDNENFMYITAINIRGINGLIQYIFSHKNDKYFNSDAYIEIIRRQQGNNNIRTIVDIPYGVNADIPNPYNFSKTEIYFCPVVYVHQWLNQSFIASTGSERSTVYIRNVPDITKINRLIHNVYLKYNGVYSYTSTSRSHEEVPSFDIIYFFE